MKIILKTKVNGYYLDVIGKFDLSLFEALKPPLAKMEIVDFTGSKKGDKVHIKFIAPIKSEWISLITEDGQDDKRAYFVDEGHLLPFPLKKWKHRHIVEKIDDNNAFIIDDISYSASNFILDLFLYPVMYLSFFPRKRIYRRYFANL